MGNVKILLDFGRRVRYFVSEAHVECSSLENLKERDCKRLFPRLRTVLVFIGYVVSVKKFIVILGEAMVTQEPDVYVI